MPRTPEGDAAWARMNKILEENGGKDTAEYRRAWREWEIAVGPASPTRENRSHP